MQREAFIRTLEEKRIPYRLEEGRIMVGRWRSDDIDLSGVKEIPSGVVFNTIGNIILPHVEEIPSGVEFRASFIHLDWLRRICPSVRLLENGFVFSPLFGTGVYDFDEIKFKVPGMSDYRVLNRMISLGLFWRR